MSALLYIRFSFERYCDLTCLYNLCCLNVNFILNSLQFKFSDAFVPLKLGPWVTIIVARAWWLYFGVKEMSLCLKAAVESIRALTMDIFKIKIIISFGSNENRCCAIIVVFIAVHATFDHWNNIRTEIKQHEEECSLRCHFDSDLRII